MENKIGVALSGGGFRAAAFHLGTLNKLDELGILPHVKVISTISGGSIVGAYYGLNSADYVKFSKGLYEKLSSVNIIREMVLSIRFLLVNLALVALIVISAMLSKVLLIVIFVLLVISAWKWQYRIMPLSNIIESSYRRRFFGNMTLADLSADPLIAINATNLQTGRLFTFSRNKMGDSGYIYGNLQAIRFKNERFPTARAVMASSCVPQFFSPVRISREFFSDPADYDVCQPILVDGGIYDNEGIHKLTQPGSSYECDLIIASDAGNNMPFAGSYNNTFSLLVRTIGLFMQRIKFLQMMKNIYQPSAKVKDKGIAYFSLGWDLENCIPGFVEALKDGLISAEVVGKHCISEEMMTDTIRYRADIISLLETSVGYQDILKRNLTESQRVLARKVKTNLIRLKRPCLDYLIRHAENMAELQMRLYLPQLFS